MKLFITVWSGGFEPSSIAAFKTYSEAEAKAFEWGKNINWDAGDSMLIISIDVETAQTELVHSFVPGDF